MHAHIRRLKLVSANLDRLVGYTLAAASHRSPQVVSGILFDATTTTLAATRQVINHPRCSEVRETIGTDFRQTLYTSDAVRSSYEPENNQKTDSNTKN